MLCSALRHFGVVITGIGTRAGTRFYHFRPQLLMLGKAPHGLEMKPIVQQVVVIVQTVDGAEGPFIVVGICGRL